MQHYRSIRFVFLFLLAVFVFGGIAIWVQTARAAETVHEIPLQVQLPGTAKCTQPGYTDRYCVKDIGEYILNFYRWFVSITGVLAVAMVVLGGFQWISAAGNSSKISSAKEIMNGAFSGIILVMLSFLLLQLINPQILSLRLPVSDIGKVEFTIGQAFCGGRAIEQTGLSCGEIATLAGQSETTTAKNTCIYEGNCTSTGKVCSISDVEKGTWGCMSLFDACRSIDREFCSWVDGQILNSTDVALKNYSCAKADLGGGLFGSDGCRAGKVLPTLYTWDSTPDGIDDAKYGCSAFLESDDGKSARVGCDLAGLVEKGTISTSCWDPKKGPKTGDDLSSGAISYCSDDARVNESTNSACCAYYEKKAIDCQDTRRSDDIEVDCAYYNSKPCKYQSGGSGPDEAQTCSKKCWMDLYLYTPDRSIDTSGTGI